MAEPKKSRDVGASVRARLLALARQKGQAFDLLLTRYANERLLHRLCLSSHRNRFVLKGAMLITTWFDDPHRPTRDMDFLGYGDPAPDAILVTFREICAIEVDDGMVFDVDADRLSRAIAATFDRRKTFIPLEAPAALTQTFAIDAGTRRQWAAFVRDLAIEIPVFEAVVADLAEFLIPHARRARERIQTKHTRH